MKIALVITLVALGPVVAFAQAGAPTFVQSCQYDATADKAELRGVVADATGAPLLGAAVTVRCGSFRQDARTLSDGAYTFALPAGSYQLDVEAPGFEASVTIVDLDSPGPTTRDFTLQLGAFKSIVTVTAPGGYVAASSTTATKTDAPLIEIPQSVSVITNDQMTSRNVQTVNEAIRYSGSVGVDSYGNETRYDWINIRGFDQSTYGLFRDNSRWQSGQVSGQVDPYLLQEVDVVKGPASVLYGQSMPGGLVNLVTKRPTRGALGEVVLNYGSYGRTQVQADVGGPLDSDGHWLYRFTGLYRDSDTQVDHVPDNRWFVAPALTWAPSSRTTWTLLADFQQDETGWGQFLPSQGTFVDNPNGRIPRDFFTGEPGYDYFDRDQWSIGSLFEHQVSERWSIRNTFRYSSIEYDGKTVFGGGLREDLRTLDRFGFGNSLDLEMFTVDTNAYARVDTGTVRHSILIGVDYSESTSTIVSGFAAAAPIDVYGPVYGSEVPELFTYYDTRQPSSLLGLYVQDHMKIGDHWVTTLSGRYDWTEMTTEDRIAGTTAKQSPGQFSGRIGMSYLTDLGLAPYLSYSTSFLPVAGVDFFGNPFDPTEGTQVEGGLKYQPRGSNSFVTVSLFEITQTNVSVADPVHPFSSVQQGEIRSRGFELEAVGHLSNGLSYHGAYSYLDQEVTETTVPATLGKRPPLAPEQLISLAGEYMITSGALEGLGFGAGVRYVGSSAGDDANTIEVPSYTLWDASLRYVWQNIEFQLSATNVSDKTYVAVCTSATYCNYGSARKLISTVRYRWH